jgi:hypothetical protein
MPAVKLATFIAKELASSEEYVERAEGSDENANIGQRLFGSANLKKLESNRGVKGYYISMCYTRSFYS